MCQNRWLSCISAKFVVKMQINSSNGDRWRRKKGERKRRKGLWFMSDRYARLHRYVSRLEGARKINLYRVSKFHNLGAIICSKTAWLISLRSRFKIIKFCSKNMIFNQKHDNSKSSAEDASKCNIQFSRRAV